MATDNPILAQLKSDAQDVRDSNSQGTAQLIGLTDSITTLKNNEADSQLAIGAQNVIIDTAKGQSDLIAQQSRQKIGLVMGTDMSQAGEMISSLTSQYQQAEDAKAKIAQQIQAKRSVGFMDNPLEHLLNSFTINDDIDNYNAANTIASDSAQRIQTLTAMSSNAAILQKQFEAPITQATIEATAQKALETAKIAADQAKIGGLTSNIEGVKFAMQAPIEQLKVSQILQASDAEQQRMKLAQAEFGLRLKSEARTEALYQEHLVERQDDEVARIRMAQDLQTGFNNLMGANAPQIMGSKQEMKYYISQLKNPNTPLGMKVNIALNSGQQGAKGPIAGDPAFLINVMDKDPGAVYFPPEQARVKDLLVDATKLIPSGPNAPKTKQAMDEALNTAVYAKLAEYSGDIGGHKNNPLTITNMASIAALPQFANDPLVQKVLAPGGKPITDLDNAQLVWNLGIAAVNDGKITQQQLSAGLNHLYTRGKQMNLEQNNFLRVGITPTPDMITRYDLNLNVGDQGNAMFGSRKTNMLSQVDIDAAISKNRILKLLPTGNF